ncbi:MAG: type IX secretion system membrane protein PorP/SprF [Bacteroidota bacterium]
MKQLFTILVALIFSGAALAQQAPQYSLYMFNKLNWNPAYAGLDHSLSATGLVRSQWAGLEGNPVSQNLTAHMPLYLLGGGIGINVENDAAGAQRYTTASLSYSHHKYIGNGILSFGASGGMVQRSIDGSELRTPDGEYGENVTIHGEGLLPIGVESATVTSFGAGIYYQSELFEAGLSVRNLTEPSAQVGQLNLELGRTYYFNLGFNLNINDQITIHPSLLLKSILVQTQIEFSTLIRYNDNIFVGASFRGYDINSNDAVVMFAGFKLSEKITLAYGYDLTLSDLNLVSNGSHEIMLNYNLNKRIGTGQPPRIIFNPRTL